MALRTIARKDRKNIRNAQRTPHKSALRTSKSPLFRSRLPTPAIPGRNRGCARPGENAGPMPARPPAVGGASDPFGPQPPAAGACPFRTPFRRPRPPSAIPKTREMPCGSAPAIRSPSVRWRSADAASGRVFAGIRRRRQTDTKPFGPGAVRRMEAAPNGRHCRGRTDDTPQRPPSGIAPAISETRQEPGRNPTDPRQFPLKRPGRSPVSIRQKHDETPTESRQECGRGAATSVPTATETSGAKALPATGRPPESPPRSPGGTKLRETPPEQRRARTIRQTGGRGRSKPYRENRPATRNAPESGSQNRLGRPIIA